MEECDGEREIIEPFYGRYSKYEVVVRRKRLRRDDAPQEAPPRWFGVSHEKSGYGRLGSNASESRITMIFDL